MKAIIWTKYGPPEVLQIQEVEKPTPKDNEVLIKVHASTVTIGDCELRSLKGPILFQLPMQLFVGIGKPKRIKILGQELAGEIEAVGQAVTRFKMGDQVFTWTGLRLGAYAEYTCLSEKGIMVIKPANITYEEAATLPVGGLEAVHFLRKCSLQSGEKVLVNGAGGSIGTFAVQIARYYGAEVTAVDSAGKLDMLRSIGADKVIDFAHEDFTRSGETYDVIFDVIGKSSFSRSVKSLRQNGRYLLGNPGLFQRGSAGTSLENGKKVLIWEDNRSPEDISFLKQLIETGSIKPVIDKCYSMEQIAEAHRYVETGQKKGCVVIRIP